MVLGLSAGTFFFFFFSVVYLGCFPGVGTGSEAVFFTSLRLDFFFDVIAASTIKTMEKMQHRCAPLFSNLGGRHSMFELERVEGRDEKSFFFRPFGFCFLFL
jgi:hypothetical protein